MCYPLGHNSSAGPEGFSAVRPVLFVWDRRAGQNPAHAVERETYEEAAAEGAKHTVAEHSSGGMESMREKGA